LCAQESAPFLTVEGIVRDARSRHPLPGVGVTVPGARVGTVTNADGSFSIKVRHDLGARELEFSHIGYRPGLLPIGNTDLAGVILTLVPEAIVLKDVTVVDEDARLLVENAFRRVSDNYSDRVSMLTGFYRETVRKRSNYIDIAEAVVEIRRNPYDRSIRSDRLRIVKGRRLVSPRPGDTLAVKLAGGPNFYFTGDIVGDPRLMDLEHLDDYMFTLETPAVIDERPHHTVAFEPAVVYEDIALLRGRLYIDRETLTISRAEFGIDMSDRAKVASMILRRKPASLRFTPIEASYTLTYRRREGRSYLYYIGAHVRFRCDWRRRMFSTGYTVSSETVITDGREGGVAPIPYRESFHSDRSLAESVGSFNGDEFWEDYNIIAPTESLEEAVDRHKRRHEE
jgi:hypothetical protein